MRSFDTPSISPFRPVTVFRRELITCQTETVPLVRGSSGELELLIPDFVVLGTPSGDEYRATLDDGNVAGDNGLPRVMVTQAAGIGGTIAGSCEPQLVAIRIVLGQLFPCVSTNRGLRRGRGVISSGPPRCAPSGSVSSSVSSPGCDI